MHLRDRFRTATSRTSEIPGLRRISCQTVISRLRQAGHQAGDLCDAMVSRHTVSLNVFGGVNRFDDDVHSGEQFFSDESHFKLFREDGRFRISQRYNERYADILCSGT